MQWPLAGAKKKPPAKTDSPRFYDTGMEPTPQYRAIAGCIPDMIYSPERGTYSSVTIS